MTLLSVAITTGAAIQSQIAPIFPRFNNPAYPACPLEAAYLGFLRDTEIAPFWQFVQALSYDSLCQFMHRNLMRAFPQLGASVRNCPRLAAELEHEGLLPAARQHQRFYRRDIHMSLWRAVTLLHDSGGSKSRIAELLERSGV